MLYRTFTRLSFLLLLALPLVLGACGGDEGPATTIAPSEYPLLLTPIAASGQSGAQVYIPQGDGWLEISASRSRFYNDSAFLVIWNPDTIDFQVRLLSESTWEYGHKAGGPFEFLRIGEEWTFMTDDTNRTYHARGTFEDLRFTFALFKYVPGDVLRMVPFRPGTRILNNNAEKWADTIAYVAWQLHLGPEGRSAE